MIYLIHENKDINEIALIYYIKPSENMFYKEVEEKDLPSEKDGYHRRLFYDKLNDKVYAEYEEIEKSEIDLLKEDLENTKLELSLALVELTEQAISSK